MNRRDWMIWRLHIIKRSHSHPQYGLVLWSLEYASLTHTFDIWVHRTLWTFRWVR